MARARFWHFAAALVPAAAAMAIGQGSAGPEAIRLLEPRDPWWTGVVTFAISVEAPPADPVRDVEMFLDGGWLGVLARPPWRVEQRIDGPIGPHTLQVLARLRSGRVLSRRFDVSPGALHEEAGVDLVLVPAVVAGIEGEEVPGLTAEDFVVLDEGRPAPVVSLDADPAPAHLVIALDRSGSMERRLPFAQAAAVASVAALPAGTDVSVLGFGETVSTLAPWTPDRRRLSFAIMSPSPLHEAHTALFAALERSFDLLREQPGRSALLVFSDGEESLVLDEMQDLWLERLTKRARAEGVAVNAVLYGVPGGDNPLVAIVRATGGLLIASASGTRRLRDAYAELRADLAPPYVLGIAPAPDAAAATWRRLEVTLSEPARARGNVRRARPGYLAP